ncbi:MAG: LytR family transcriptional regulator [Actinobacteria bacterium]|nr:MAG: LytR family transcriptional regulator [Actinomycetota bacterium]
MGRHSSKSGNTFGGPGDKGPHRPARRRAPKRLEGGAPLQPGPTRSGNDIYHLSDSRSRRKGPLESAPDRLRVERERRGTRNKRIAGGIAIAVLAVLAFAAIGVFAYAKHIENTMQKTVYKTADLKLDLKKAAPQKPYNMLLVGFDRRPGEHVFRTDSMLLARIDPQTKQVWMLSIPRDTRVVIPGHGAKKINDAYAIGQAELAVKTVEDFTGVPVNHFMAINFEGFEKAVDAIGGVWVDVPTEINDKKADRSPGHRAAHVDAGYQLLDGEHALTFVRSRAYADADFTRMKNQQAFFRALADQVATKTNVARIPRLVSSIAPYISTDMSLMDMLRTAQALQGAGSKRVYTATLSGEWRSPFVYTDEAKMAELLGKMQDGQPFEPKPVSSETTKTAGAATGGTGAAEKAPADISVTIRNGAGIAGCAKQAASILKAQAFDVVDTGNAGQFVYDNTLVIYKKDKAAAEQVARALPPGVKIVESRGMYSYDSEVLVVIGKDWDISRVPVTPVTSQ